MRRIPVPGPHGGESREQFSAPLEEILDSAEQKAFAESARAGEEVVCATRHQSQHVRRLVDVVVAFRPMGSFKRSTRAQYHGPGEELTACASRSRRSATLSVV